MALPDLAERGTALFAISYDPVETIADFAQIRGIAYPLLSDHGSAFIRQLGIFNDTVAADSRSYGIPYPGTYVIGVDGRVASKSFHESNYVRDAAVTLLREQLGIDRIGGPVVEAQDSVLAVRATLDSGTFVKQKRIGWRVRVALPDGFHIYGEPISDGLIPTTLTVSVPEGVVVEGPWFPQFEQMTFSYLDQPVPVISGTFDIAGALVFQDIREDVTIHVELHYQACTDTECFAPSSLQFEIPVTYEAFA